MGKFVIKNTSTGFVFYLKAANGQTIGTSEVYNAIASCRKGIESVMKNAPIAAVEDQTVEGFAQEKAPKFEIYLDKKSEPRFRLKARNGEIILSSQGYSEKSGCINGIESVKKNAPDAEVEEEKPE